MSCRTSSHFFAPSAVLFRVIFRPPPLNFLGEPTHAPAQEAPAPRRLLLHALRRLRPGLLLDRRFSFSSFVRSTSSASFASRSRRMVSTSYSAVDVTVVRQRARAHGCDRHRRCPPPAQLRPPRRPCCPPRLSLSLWNLAPEPVPRAWDWERHAALRRGLRAVHLHARGGSRRVHHALSRALRLRRSVRLHRALLLRGHHHLLRPRGAARRRRLRRAARHRAAALGCALGGLAESVAAGSLRGRLRGRGRGLGLGRGSGSGAGAFLPSAAAAFATRAASLNLFDLRAGTQLSPTSGTSGSGSSSSSGAGAGAGAFLPSAAAAFRRARGFFELVQLAHGDPTLADIRDVFDGFLLLLLLVHLARVVSRSMTVVSLSEVGT